MSSFPNIYSLKRSQIVPDLHEESCSWLGLKSQIFRVVAGSQLRERPSSQFLYKCKPDSKSYGYQVAWAQINMHSVTSLGQLACRCNHFTQHALFQPKGTEQNAAARRWEGYGECKAKQRYGLELSNRVKYSSQYHLEPFLRNVAQEMRQQVINSFGRRCPEQKAPK